jgi:hypothetical protein
MEAGVSFRSDLILRVAALSLIAACGACSDNLARRDTIALSAGNAMAANRAIQTIDPYPRRSFLRGQQTDGVKAQQAVRRYLTPDTGPIVTPTVAPGGAAPATGP